MLIYYRSPTKLGEGNVFTDVCQPFCPWRVDISGTRSILWYLWYQVHSGGYLFSGGFRGAPPARAPLRPKIFSISCSFSQNLAKSCWRPLLRGILDPPPLLYQVYSGGGVISCTRPFRRGGACPGGWVHPRGWVCLGRGYVQGWGIWYTRDTVGKRAVRILLECFLVGSWAQCVICHEVRESNCANFVKHVYGSMPQQSTQEGLSVEGQPSARQ